MLAEYYQALADYHRTKAADPLAEIPLPKKPKPLTPEPSHPPQPSLTK